MPSRIVIKIGGNALTDPLTKTSIIEQICSVQEDGHQIVLVHGGGIEIKELLSSVNIQSAFAGGHRITDETSIAYVEMALSGRVNKELVRLLNARNKKAVGISGKDGPIAIAEKRYHSMTEDGNPVKKDIGFVGDVVEINTGLINLLLEGGYLPVLSPVSIGRDGNTYNINADLFAGQIAGAMNADKFIAMTNIDGLLADVKDPGSIIHRLTASEARKLYGSVIQGGMIPKIDSCLKALEHGVTSSHIINGTDRQSLLRLIRTNDTIGTIIVKNDV